MNQLKPLVSIIIPAYNAERFIAQTIDSVLKQTYSNWKTIICGDGVDLPSYEDNRITSISIPEINDQGQVRNYAATLVDSEWIAFLDDDDYIRPEYLEKFLPFLQESDIVVSRMMNYGFEIPMFHEIVHSRVGISFAVRTDVFKSNPMPSPPSEDYKFLELVLGRGYRFSFTDYTGYYVRQWQSDPNYFNIKVNKKEELDEN